MIQKGKTFQRAFWGWGGLSFGIRSSLNQSCVSGREGSQLCVYPSFLVRNLPWAQERAGSRRLLQSIPQRGRRCREPGSYHTVNLYVVLPYKNKPQSVSRPREKDRSEPGLRLCQQGRLASLRKVMIPTRSFAVADDGGGGKEKVLQGKLNLPSERNENQAWL